MRSSSASRRRSAAMPYVRAPGAAGSAARHELGDAVELMHDTVRRLGNPDFHVTALIARWRATSATFTWVNCGHPPAYLVDLEGNLVELAAPPHPPLGTRDADLDLKLSERRLQPGERLILLTDGIISRGTAGGGQVGVDGRRDAVERAESATAAATAMAIQQAVTESWSEPL